MACRYKKENKELRSLLADIYTISKKDCEDNNGKFAYKVMKKIMLKQLLIDNKTKA